MYNRTKNAKQERDYARRIREERTSSGMCPRCGKDKPQNGFVSCRTCLDNIAKQRRERKNAGLCTKCGKRPSEPGYTCCSICKEQLHKLYLDKVADGRNPIYYRLSNRLCTQCGSQLPDDEYNKKKRRTCDSCREKKRNKKAQRRNYRYPHILERDGYSCQICGRKTRLCVHHIDGNGETQNGIEQPRIIRNDSPDNLITICTFCHYAITCLRQADIIHRKKAIDLLLA